MTMTDGVGSISWVECLETSIVKHGLENTRIQQLGLFNHASNHLLARLFGLGLDKTHHCDVALELDILPQVKPFLWRAQTLKSQLWRFRCFHTRLISLDTISVSHVDIHGRVDVSLKTPWHIVEASVKGDFARADLAHAGDILDALSDFIPGAVVFVGGCIARGGDGFMAEDERVESDDFAVGVEDIEGELSGDEAGNGRDDGEGFFSA